MGYVCKICGMLLRKDDKCVRGCDQETGELNTEHTNDLNVQQIGGDHYQAEYQHWDWAIDSNIGYFGGNATKYVWRWKKKGGIRDLKKAMSYIDKIIKNPNSFISREYNEQQTKTGNAKLVKLSILDKREERFCICLSKARDLESLLHCKSILQEILNEANLPLWSGEQTSNYPLFGAFMRWLKK